MTAHDQYASVHYIVDVVRGPLRLLLSGPASSGARATPDDAAAAGRNRIHLVVEDLDAEIARLREASLCFRSDVVADPGRRQILLADAVRAWFLVWGRPDSEGLLRA